MGVKGGVCMGGVCMGGMLMGGVWMGGAGKETCALSESTLLKLDDSAKDVRLLPPSPMPSID